MKNLKRLIFVFWIFAVAACLCLPVAADAGKVNINTDGKEVLMTLKGVGEAIADRIIEYRKAHPFNAPEEIMNVKGVGKKIFEENKDKIVTK